MEWADEGLLLSVRKHGESSAILEALTARHGRHFGLMRGGASRKNTPLLQPGAQLSLRWRARLEDHLGGFQAEPLKIRPHTLMQERAALEALTACTSLLSAFLPERDPQPELYQQTCALLDALTASSWRAAYAVWELSLLESLGYGLDLTACASTGQQHELIWVSPKSGRAVSKAAGAPYADKLLPLPAFLQDAAAPCAKAEFHDALALSGFFLEKRAAQAIGLAQLPPARRRLLDTAQKAAQAS